MFWFSPFLSKTFLILRRSQRDIIISVYWSSCQVLMKTEFSRQIFENYSNINFQKIRPVGAEMFHADGQADRHDDANSCFSQSCEDAWKNWCYIEVVQFRLVVCQRKSFENSCFKVSRLLYVLVVFNTENPYTSSQKEFMCSVWFYEQTTKFSSLDTINIRNEHQSVPHFLLLPPSLVQIFSWPPHCCTVSLYCKELRPSALYLSHF